MSAGWYTGPGGMDTGGYLAIDNSLQVDSSGGISILATVAQDSSGFREIKGNIVV